MRQDGPATDHSSRYLRFFCDKAFLDKCQCFAEKSRFTYVYIQPQSHTQAESISFGTGLLLHVTTAHKSHSTVNRGESGVQIRFFAEPSQTSIAEKSKCKTPQRDAHGALSVACATHSHKHTHRQYRKIRILCFRCFWRLLLSFRAFQPYLTRKTYTCVSVSTRDITL